MLPLTLVIPLLFTFNVPEAFISVCAPSIETFCPFMDIFFPSSDMESASALMLFPLPSIVILAESASRIIFFSDFMLISPLSLLISITFLFLSSALISILLFS